MNTQTVSYQYNPTVAGLTNGDFVITWYDTSPLGDGDGNSIKAQRYTAAGAKIGTEFLVNTQTTGSQYIPIITALTNGGFVITWFDTGGTLGDSDVSIKAQIFDASGTKVGTEFLVNTQTSGNQWDASVGPLSNGGFVITWYDSNPIGDGSDASVKAQVFAADGTKVGTEFLVNTQTSGDQWEAAVTGLADG